MNFIKRAFLSLTKRKIKTLILIAVLCVIANMILSGLAIQSATKKSTEFARKKLGGAVTLELDFQKALKNPGSNSSIKEVKSLTATDIDKLKDLKHVNAYNYSSTVMVKAEGFNPIKNEENDKKAPIISSSGSGGAQPDIVLEGNLYSELSSDFAEGKCKLIEGRNITKEDENKDVVLISKNLMEKNKLKLGDKIKLSGIQGKKNKEVEIIGIYEIEKFQSNKMMDALVFLNPYNKIYAPNSVVSTVSFEGKSGNSDVDIQKAIYYLEDPIYVQDFKNQVENSGINLNNYRLDAKDSLYKQMTEPLENLGSFSKKFVILVILTGAVILSLIIILSLKDRRYEIGVLLSMGESRIKIISQLLVEILISTCIAFGISIYTGKVVAQKIGDNLLQKEIVLTEKQKKTESPREEVMIIGAGEPSDEKAPPIDKIDVSVNMKDLGNLYLMGFALVIIATAVPTISILRFNPKTILSNNE